MGFSTHNLEAYLMVYLLSFETTEHCNNILLPTRNIFSVEQKHGHRIRHGRRDTQYTLVQSLIFYCNPPPPPHLHPLHLRWSSFGNWRTGQRGLCAIHYVAAIQWAAHGQLTSMSILTINNPNCSNTVNACPRLPIGPFVPNVVLSVVNLPDLDPLR